MQGQYETKISKRNLEQIFNPNMTPSEIIRFLEEGALYRSFSDVLHAAYPGTDLADRLKTQLLADLPETASKKEADSVRKNIANWLKGVSTPRNREQLFKICFALGLGETESSKVLASASETGIHYRNPQELVYAFALRTRLSYPQAAALNQEMAQIYGPIVREAQIERAAKWKTKERVYREARAEARRRQKERAKKGLPSETYIGPLEEREVPSFLTQQVIHRFEHITTPEELRLFFVENSANLGNIHESAYEKFWHLMMELQEPDDVILSERGDDESYSIDTIAETYFRMNVPLQKETRKFGYLQKAVKKNWPGATELNRMQARKIDVSRKALLLLFIITEDFLYSEDLQFSDQSEKDAAWYLPAEDESPRDQLEIVLNKINLFLETYGMNQLDPGNPFDCLFLYALAAEYGEDYLSDKFSHALSVLFPPEEEKKAGPSAETSRNV